MRVLGQLEHAKLEFLATDPTGDNLYEGRIWYNSTSKQFKTYADSVIQIIPFHGVADLTIAAGTNILPPGAHYFKNLTIDAGATLKILGNSEPCIIFVAQDLDVSGTIDYSAVGSFRESRTFIVSLPRGELLSLSIDQKNGGAGGAGGDRTGISSGGTGGAQSVGYGGGGGGGAIGAGVGGNGAIVGGNGPTGGGANGGLGGTGVDGNSCDNGISNVGNSILTSLRRFSLTGSASTFAGVVGSGATGGRGGSGFSAGGGGAGDGAGNGGGGGGGGMSPGLHGGIVVLYVLGDISGTGSIDVSGSAGDAGSAGGNGFGTAGGGGGGGGSAGGSAGHVQVYYSGTNTLSGANAVLTGGTGGAGGAGGALAGAGTGNGVNGSAGTAGDAGTFTATQLT